MSDEMFSPDTGALIHFDHINLRVDDHKLAICFFVEGLGLTRDPYRMVGTGNMWVNAGREQFHLPLGQPKPFPGTITLAMPELSAVAAGLGRIQPALEGTAFSWREEGEALLTTSPWGHALRVIKATPSRGAPALGLPLVSLRVPPGATPGIARFYRDWLHCPVEQGNGKEAPWTEVSVGANQKFRFEEQISDHRPGGDGSAGNHHVAVYLSQYREIYQKFLQNGGVMESHGGEQFRFRNIIDPENGLCVYTLEHEMRSLYHRDYRRPLVNRLLDRGEGV